MIENPSAVSTPHRRLISTRCKPVVVRAANEAMAAQYQPPAKPVTVGQVFQSAALASDHLGFNCNAVAIRLADKRARARRAAAAGQHQTGSEQITLRGVTLAYVEATNSSTPNGIQL